MPERDTLLAEFSHEAGLIRGLKQARSERAVHLYGATDHLLDDGTRSGQHERLLVQRLRQCSHANCPGTLPDIAKISTA